MAKPKAVLMSEILWPSKWHCVKTKCLFCLQFSVFTSILHLFPGKFVEAADLTQTHEDAPKAHQFPALYRFVIFFPNSAPDKKG